MTIDTVKKKLTYSKETDLLAPIHAYTLSSILNFQNFDFKFDLASNCFGLSVETNIDECLVYQNHNLGIFVELPILWKILA